MITEYCRECHGDGRTRVEREVEVEVPAGVTSENYLTLRGEGSVGPRGGPRGDIMVLLDVAEDPRFRRDGTDLVVDVPITFGQAALGDRVAVPTVEGRTWVEVPPGTQNGEVMRVAGEGVPELHGRRYGDLLVRLSVWVPTRLSDEQRRLVDELRAVEDSPPDIVDAEQRRGFWSRVKEALG